MTTQPITTALFDFLRDLRENNDREWFQANKGRYLAEVRDPMLDFIGAFAAPLAEISPHFVADPRPNGGSLFRIYRDTRFSRDKTPYKTNAGAHFRHAAGKDAHAPGFYLHLEPGMCFAGCGVWRPDGPTVTKIREAIDVERDAWTRVTTARAFTETFELSGDSLKRPPRGYEADHPLVEDLKRKDFIALMSFSEAEVVKSDFLDWFAGIARRGAPLVEFLSRRGGGGVLSQPVRAEWGGGSPAGGPRACELHRDLPVDQRVDRSAGRRNSRPRSANQGAGMRRTIRFDSRTASCRRRKTEPVQCGARRPADTRAEED